MDFSLLYFFIPVFFVVSITPGLCMTLALTMGMSIGLGNTMKMMVGELTGVLLVATVVVVGGGGIIALDKVTKRRIVIALQKLKAQPFHSCHCQPGEDHHS